VRRWAAGGVIGTHRPRDTHHASRDHPTSGFQLRGRLVKQCSGGVSALEGHTIRCPLAEPKIMADRDSPQDRSLTRMAAGVGRALVRAAEEDVGSSVCRFV
jgi:hypothetical protein